MNEEVESEKKATPRMALFFNLVCVVLLGVIALSLVCVSMLSFKAYNLAEESYQLAKNIHEDEQENKIKAEIEKKRISDEQTQKLFYEIAHKDELNIEEAKKTLYKYGKIGSMLEEGCNDITWEYIEFTRGGFEVVNASGSFNNPVRFVDSIHKHAMVIKTDDFREKYEKDILMGIDSENISKLIFRVQFTKLLGVEHKTEYNHYMLDYVEIEIYRKDKTEPEKHNLKTDFFLDSLLFYNALYDR